MSGGDVENVVIEELSNELKDVKSCYIMFLADDCDHKQYNELVKAMCNENNVKIVVVPTKAMLGEWTAQCKFNSEGESKNVANCSCAVVTSIKFTSELERLRRVMQTK
ncbi:40S ribosomal protein S12 [Entamoeba marina]